jgi:hypothetical protein
MLALILDREIRRCLSSVAATSSWMKSELIPISRHKFDEVQRRYHSHHIFLIHYDKVVHCSSSIMSAASPMDAEISMEKTCG